MPRRKTDWSLRLGVFAISALALLYLIFVIFTHIQGAQGYRIGVRFKTASGLSAGAPVYLSGVQIGSVETVELLPDDTVEVILAITKDVDLAADSRITIHSGLTGSPDIRIFLPRLRVARGSVPKPLPATAIIPKQILPLNEQPLGRAPMSPQELLAQSQALLHRSGRIVKMLQDRRHVLLADLNGIRANSGAASSELHALPQGLRASLSGTLSQAIAETKRTQVLLKAHNQKTLADLPKSLEATSGSLNQTMNALQGIRTDPAVRANMSSAMRNVQQASAAMHSASTDLETIGGNPQTHAELEDANLQLRASVEKLRYLITHNLQ